MHRTSPPDLPPLPLARGIPQRSAVASWQHRSALHHVAAALVHVICAVFALLWLTDDWKTQWGDQTFINAAYLSYGTTLIGAFGKWLLMALLLLCLALAAAQCALAAAVFRYSTRRSVLMVFAWLSILTPPLGTLAGLYALRSLKAAEKALNEPLHRQIGGDNGG